MKQIFIDRFNVPQSAVNEFVDRMNLNRNFIQSVSGFIKDTVYKRTDENGDLIIITIAEWKDETSLVNAKELVQSEYKRIGFNPQEMMTRLNITMERNIYTEL